MKFIDRLMGILMSTRQRSTRQSHHHLHRLLHLQKKCMIVLQKKQMMILKKKWMMILQKKFIMDLQMILLTILLINYFLD